MEKYRLCFWEVSLKTRIMIMGIIEMIVATILLIVSITFTAIATEKLKYNETEVSYPEFLGELTHTELWTLVRIVFSVFAVINLALIGINGSLVYGVRNNIYKLFIPWFIYQSLNILCTFIISTLFCVYNFKTEQYVLGVVSIFICVFVSCLTYLNVSATYKYYKYLRDEFNPGPFSENQSTS